MAQERESLDEDRERAFAQWEARRIQELTGDPEIQAQLDRYTARIAAGLEPEGILMTPDELRRRANL